MKASEVADRAERYSRDGKFWGAGYCLKFSRTCAGAPGGVLDATTAWKLAHHRHSGGTPPRGSFVWWSGGSRGHGHVGISDGRGYVWSTDIKREGRVDRVSIPYVTARWRNLSFLGWSEDVNGVRVDIEPTTIPSVLLSSLRPGQRGEDVKELQLALRRKGFAKLNPSGATGYYGDETKAMVAAFQKSEPSLDGLADGIPGPKTAALLGLQVA